MSEVHIVYVPMDATSFSSTPGGSLAAWVRSLTWANYSAKAKKTLMCPTSPKARVCGTNPLAG